MSKLKKLEEPKEKPKHTVLKEWGNIDEIDRLYRIYNQDHQKAKIIYTQKKKNFKRNRLVLFEWSNGDFKICSLTRTYGVSKSAMIYHREKTNSSIMYKKKGNKFYHIGSFNNIKQLSFYQISEMGLYFDGECTYSLPPEQLTSSVTSVTKLKLNPTPQYAYLLSRFGWLRNIEENPMFWSISFNAVYREKLFNTNKLLKYYFGCPIETCRTLIAAKSSMESWRSQTRLDKSWDEMKKHLINLENITVEFLKSEYLYDTSLMAEALGKKINCAWSPKRLKAEHDVWMKEVIDVILEFEPLRELKIAQIFQEFQEFSGYEMLTTNHHLIAEGQRLNHCVGMYSHVVDRGNSCIYRVNGYTLELGYGIPWSKNDTELAKKNGIEKLLLVKQYRGYKNISAPDELSLEVNGVVNAFNETLKGDYICENGSINVDANDLPF
jgi:hypothetical protein